MTDGTFARLHAAQELVYLRLFKRHRVDSGPHKAGDARRVAHHIPRLVVYYHFDKHVAGVDLFLLLDPAAAFNFDRVLCRHNHLEHFVGKAQRLYALSQVARYRVFIPRIGMYCIPCSAHTGVLF